MMRIRIESSPRPQYLYRRSRRQIKPILPSSDLSSEESPSDGPTGPHCDSTACDQSPVLSGQAGERHVRLTHLIELP
jgi:hypothetical protein